uniref:Protein TRANSPARENT TESTA 12-like n=1 Tax=Populus alba TaxID=43335 RepID=A0A4U5MZ16_POPAL|nr:hypothetical protein D5086_0000289280 [Populus alba]
MEGEINEKLLRKGGEVDAEELRFKDKLWTETKKMWVVAGPAIFTRFSTFGINVVSQAFIGHIGSTELAAYSLVFTVLLRFSNGILESSLTHFILCFYSLLESSLKMFLHSSLLGKFFKDVPVCSLNINGWEMMISLGFLAAASVRVSNELGRGSSKAAKFSIVVTVLTSFSIGLLLFLVFLFARGSLAYVFTSSHEVASAVANLSPLLAFSILLNSVQPVLSGVAVGAGWQSIVAYINIACYYLVGIPIGVVLGYVMDLQVKGVWIGMLIGTFIQTVVLLIVTYRTDWEKQVIVAHNKINKWFVADPEETSTQVA